jgi:hypothetical protein
LWCGFIFWWKLEAEASGKTTDENGRRIKLVVLFLPFNQKIGVVTALSRALAFFRLLNSVVLKGFRLGPRLTFGVVGAASWR